jgi:NADH dehydrogenase (ubiquinone) 1 alpha subcomplex subunit 13
LKEEKLAARVALVPLLQAEEDRRYVAVQRKALVAEALLMSGKPGWKAGESVYNGGRWTPPALSLRPNPSL